MQSTLRLAVLALFVVGIGWGCSGDSVNPRFAKTWTGTATVTIPGASPLSYPSQLTITVSGDSATATNICPDGSGSVTAHGNGDTINWTGSVDCPPVALSCGSATLTYKTATSPWAMTANPSPRKAPAQRRSAASRRRSPPASWGRSPDRRSKPRPTPPGARGRLLPGRVPEVTFVSVTSGTRAPGNVSLRCRDELRR